MLRNVKCKQCSKMLGNAPKNIIIDSSFEIENIFTLRKVILNLLRLVLFYSKGRGSFYAAAMSPFITDYRGPILGLSKEVSFVLEICVFPEILIKMIY